MKYKHIVIPRFGGPENLLLLEDELFEPRANEVRVKVLAAGVSFADILMREGVHPESMNRRTPFTLGWDIVGIVDKLGDKVSTWQTGQMVAALPIVGGYAEYVILSSNELVPVPPGLDPAEAVSLILNYTTAYQMLHRCADIKSGETILIHSNAAGGVGTALLQLGKLANLKMYGTASYEKRDIVSNLGGIPIDCKSVDLVQEIIKLTGHNGDDEGEWGVDAVFDGLGGKSLKSSYEILRSGGRLVAYGPFSTTDIENWMMMFTSNLLPDKRKFILYSIQTLKRLKPVWFHEDLILLLNLLKQGKIKPIVAARMPLNQAAQAHELLASGSAKGKIVLICND
jgi:NADPH:quinone reductase-like Zn-dependent oxidoreductase